MHLHPRPLRSMVTLLTLLACSPLLAQVVPITSLFEAEYFSDKAPAVVKTTWQSQMTCKSGDWLAYDNIDFANGTFDSAVIYLVNNWDDLQNGEADVRIDAIDGQLIGTVRGISRTDWGELTAPKPYSGPISRISGVHRVYVLFRGDAGKVVGYIDRLGFSGSVNLSTLTQRDFYVAMNGNDSDSGTLAHPFRTVGKGVASVRPGGTCYIRQGIYRETVRPACSGAPGSPITIRNYNNEDVYVSGADPLTGWTAHSGSIYKTHAPWSLGQVRDQLFCDGQMMWVARSPNVDEQCLEYERWPYFIPACVRDRQDEIFPILIPGLMPAGTETPRIDSDAFRAYDQFLWGWEMPQATFNRSANFFTGGLITVFTSWYATIGRITSSRATVAPTASKEGSIQFYADRIALQRSGAGRGFVSHLLPLLDAPREWFLQDSTLYVWLPDGSNPTTHLIEMKRREVAVNLNGRSYVNLTGIRIMAGSLTMSNAEHCIVDGCDIRFASHFDAFTNAETNMHWDPTWDSTQYDPATGWKGVYVSGHDNIIRNSTVAYSAGSGIIVDGRNQTITNCRIHDCDYTCTYDAGILVCTGKASSYGHQITHNSLYNMGRSAIHFAFGGGDLVDPTVIQYNDFRLSGLLAYETGHIYAYGGSGFNSDVSYNWFHDQSGGGNGHISLDNGHSLWKIHHNVFWNGNKRLDSRTLFCNVSLDTSSTWGALDTFYNNTFIDTSVVGEYWWVTATRWEDSAHIVYGPGDNNMMCVGDTARWMFTNAKNYDFSLRAGSPAIDRGHQIPGKNLSYVGAAPDLGAYEFGQPRWVAGVDWQEVSWNYPPPESRVIWGPGENRAFGPTPTMRMVMGRAVVQGLAGESARIDVYNSRGAVVRSQRTMRQNSTVVDLRTCPDGMYVFVVTSARYRCSWKALVSRATGR